MLKGRRFGGKNEFQPLLFFQLFVDQVNVEIPIYIDKFIAENIFNQMRIISFK